MKTIFILFICINNITNCFGQEVHINGDKKNRLLTWNDFAGVPDTQSPYDANTYWNINYSYNNVKIVGDTVVINNFNILLELDANKSWVKKDKQTASLLKHEQGHFNIALLCQNELIQTLKTTFYLKQNFQQKIKQIFSDIMFKCRQMQKTYDEETDHSKNINNQIKWNIFLEKEITNAKITF